MNSNYLTSSALALLLGAESISATEMLGCRSFKGSLKDVVGNKPLTDIDGSTRKSSDMISEFIFTTLKEAGKIGSREEFEAIQDQILIAGWGGLCATSDGRTDGEKFGVPEKQFAYRTVRGAKPCQLQTLWNPKRALQDDAFNTIQFQKDSVYEKVTKKEAIDYYLGLGNMNYTTVNKLKDGAEFKPSWASGHPKLTPYDFQVDVGTGKLLVSLKLKNGHVVNRVGKKWSGNIPFTSRKNPEWGRSSFAKELVKISESDAEDDGKILAFLRKKLSKLSETLQDAHKAGLTIPEEPTMAFGLTGAWREMGEHEDRILNLFRDTICELFPWCKSRESENLVFLVTGDEEAQYGGQSFGNIPGLYSAARKGGIRYFVSAESGNRTTQIVVTDIVCTPDSEQEFKDGCEARAHNLALLDLRLRAQRLLKLAEAPQPALLSLQRKEQRLSVLLQEQKRALKALRQESDGAAPIAES